MKVAVADDGAPDGGRPVVGEPARTGSEPGELRALDLAFQLPQVALDGQRMRWHARSRERAADGLGVDGVQVDLGLRQDRSHANRRRSEHRVEHETAWNHRHDHERQPEPVARSSDQQHRWGGIAGACEDVLDRALEACLPWISVRPVEAQDEASGEPGRRSPHAERVDEVVEAPVDTLGRLGIINRISPQTAAQVVEQLLRHVRSLGFVRHRRDRL
jgi:hypothetical protein